MKRSTQTPPGDSDADPADDLYKSELFPPTITAITAVRVAGFKAIPRGNDGNGFAIALAPITMLYGQNSVGKSSLLEAIEVFAASLTKGELDLSCIPGASFADVVHGKDSRDNFAIALTFKVWNPVEEQWPTAVDVEVELLFAKTGMARLAIVVRNPVNGAVIRRVELEKTGAGTPTLTVDGYTRGFRSYFSASQGLAKNDPLWLIPLCAQFLSTLRHIEPVRPAIPDFLLNGPNSLGANILQNLRMIGEWLQRLYPHHSLEVSRIDTGLGAEEQLIAVRVGDSRSADTLMKLSELGSGVTQALPCLVACLRDRRADAPALLMLEQPELHLNARSQVELGSLLQESIGLNNLLIVETHSEYLMIRLQSLVRSGALASDAVIIYESLKPAVAESGSLFIRHEFLDDGTIDPPLVEDFLDVFEMDRVNYPANDSGAQ
jgi:hypothetical protein